MAALKDVEPRVESAIELIKAKTQNHTIKQSDDPEGWQSYLDDFIAPVLNQADHDLKDAARRIQSVKKKAENNQEKDQKKSNDAQKSDDDFDDDDGEESG